MKKISNFLSNNPNSISVVFFSFFLVIFISIFYLNHLLSQANEKVERQSAVLLEMKNKITSENIMVKKPLTIDAQVFLLKIAKRNNINITIQSFTAGQVNLKVTGISINKIVVWLEDINRESGIYLQQMTMKPSGDMTSVDAEMQLAWRIK